MTATPGTWHDDAPAVPVAMKHAKEAWAGVARHVLERVASSYNSTITYQELAQQVQDETGIRTRMLVHYWIGDVLGRVARECHGEGLPLLSALCVNAEGSVGDGYGIALAETHGGELPDDLDVQAAAERLECYRRFASDLPADGGRPALTPKLAASRAYKRQLAARSVPPVVCPTCHLQLPLTGICDTCN